MRFKQLSRARAPKKTTAPDISSGAKSRRRTSTGAGETSVYRRVQRAGETLLDNFESYLEQHALSPTTVRNYLADLRAFLRWSASAKPRAIGFVAEDFQAYRIYLCNETGHSIATVNRRLQSLRLFGRFLHEMGRASENPTRDIELIHNGAGRAIAPRTLTPSEITRLTSAIRSGRPSLVERDHAIMQLMLQAGLRVHEVAALRLRDLLGTRRGMSIEIRGRLGANDHGRRVPLNASAAKALKQYVAARPAIPHVDHLFVSQRGQPLSMRSIQRVIDTHARSAGLEGVCAQLLRHTCTKTMLEETQDRALVARWLGHRSERVLGRYH